MSERKKRIRSALLSLVYIIMLFAFIVPCSTSAETKASVALICAEDSVKVEGMKWRIYKVGERRDGAFALTGSYSRYPIDVRNLTKENVNGTAQALESFIIGDSLGADAADVTNENGTVVFDGLGLGLYLAVADKVKKEPLVYTAAPMLFEVKEGDSEEEAFPKIYSTVTLTGKSTRYTVKKVWADNNDIHKARPVNVTVDLFKNGELYDTVELNEESKWEYSWNTLDADADWRVVERNIPSKYVLILEHNSYQFLIKNTYTDEFDDSDIHTTTRTSVTTSATSTNTSTTSVSSVTTAVTSGKTTVTSGTTTTTTAKTDLPQTGQLWWPVIPLAFGGMILLCAGLMAGKRSNDDEK
jgi:hypothetical protein